MILNVFNVYPVPRHLEGLIGSAMLAVVQGTERQEAKTPKAASLGVNEKRITAAQARRAKIVALASNHTAREIAEQLNCHTETVHQHLREAGVRAKSGTAARIERARAARAQREAQATRLHEAGLSFVKIAKVMGVSSSTASDLVKYHKANQPKGK